MRGLEDCLPAPRLMREKNVLLLAATRRGAASALSDAVKVALGGEQRDCACDRAESGRCAARPVNLSISLDMSFQHVTARVFGSSAVNA